MLPFLPAILLLLLQGPSNVERLVQNGRAPMGMEAVCRAAGETPTLREMEQVVLATLLAAGEDPGLSDTLLALLRTERTRRETPAQPVRAESSRPLPPADLSPPDGFARSQRVRDGPIAVA